jgi:hypothetical protein
MTRTNRDWSKLFATDPRIIFSLTLSGLPGPKNIKEAQFGHNKFHKGQILKCEKGQIKAEFSMKLFKINSGISFAKIGQKDTIFIKIVKNKKMAKWPGRINLISATCFIKGQMATLIFVLLIFNQTLPITTTSEQRPLF